MFTNTDDKLSRFLFIIFLFAILDIPSVSAFNTETNNIKPCLPCDKSIHHTLKSLNISNDIINNIPEQKCYDSAIYSLMMTYSYISEPELDLGVSIVRPFENKNEWCTFHVHRKNKIQTIFLVNENTTIRSSDDNWSLLPQNNPSKFWLIQKAPMTNDNSGNEK